MEKKMEGSECEIRSIEQRPDSIGQELTQGTSEVSTEVTHTQSLQEAASKRIELWKQNKKDDLCAFAYFIAINRDINFFRNSKIWNPVQMKIASRKRDNKQSRTKEPKM